MHSRDDYLDVTIFKVRPEKRTDFDAVAHRIAEANRKAKGDFWTATEVVYGENNTVQIVSPRQNYAAIDSGTVALMNAIKEGYAREAFQKWRPILTARFSARDLKFAGADGTSL